MKEVSWVEYARLQSVLDRTTDAYKAAGIESAMADLLEKITQNEILEANQVKNLVVNRIGKERRRRVIVRVHSQDLMSNQSHQVGVEDAVECRLMLIQCAKVCAQRDLELFVRRGNGYSYPEIASTTGVSVSSLKTRMHRARKLVQALVA